jgi:hypothetical protein
MRRARFIDLSDIIATLRLKAERTSEVLRDRTAASFRF